MNTVVPGARTPRRVLPQLASAILLSDRVCATLSDERCAPVNHAGNNERVVRSVPLVGPVARARFVGIKFRRAQPRGGFLQRLQALLWSFDVT